jgi:prepilin-type processing-associated H-X9-DG protein
MALTKITGEGLGTIDSADLDGAVTINESSADKDFRVESNGNANMLFVDGGNDEVGIGTGTPSGHSSPNGAKLVVHTSSGASMIQINATGSSQSSGIEFTDDASSGQMHYWHGDNSLTTTVNGTQHFKIASNGDLTATDTSIGAISDERLKTNLKNYTYDLEVFKKFKPKTFDWKNPKQHGDKSGVRGFSAQDILDVDNYLVSQTDIEPNTGLGNLDAEADLIPKDSDGKRLSYTSKLDGNDAMYISVIQQLITRIEALEDA